MHGREPYPRRPPPMASPPPPPLTEASSPVALFSLPPETEEAKVSLARWEHIQGVRQTPKRVFWVASAQISETYKVVGAERPAPHQWHVSLGLRPVYPASVSGAD